MGILSVLAFAVALSMDGFGAGIAYGIRKIRIPVLSLVVISLTSSTAIGISMAFGHLISRYVSVQNAEFIGSAILIFVGLWILLQTWSANKEKRQDDPILNLKIKPLGLVVQILHEPTVADIDRSGNISLKEAVLLGAALAMDALGAGFGAAMTGFGTLLTPVVVGMVKFILLTTGVFLGRNYAAGWLGDRASALPGWLLIFLGLARVIKIV